MILEELSPKPDSKKLAEVTKKTFGFSVDLASLDLPKAKQIKESFTTKLAKLEAKLGANVSTNKRYYEAKLVLETLDRFIEEGVDDDALRELELYAENDQDLYSRSYVPIAKNLSKKFKKEIYDSELAKKLWKYHADRAAQKYGKDHAGGAKDGMRMFSPDTRRALAAQLEDSWRNEMEAGNFMESASPVSEDSNYKIIMGFIDQWTEAGQPDDYMDDLVAYVKKTIPDSKDWNYAASLIKNGVESYQNREYGTSSLMGLRNNTESVEVTSESIIVEGEMESAEVVMAAKNIIDRIQGMVEDLGEIMNEDLPPLADTITDQFGAEASAAFTAQIQGAVGPAMEAMGAARGGADAAARGLTGEDAQMMGAPEEDVPMEPTMDMDIEQPIEEPGDEIAAADSAAGGEAELGRERR
jgi:hypothetical protein